jgi:hypothetical protein
MTIEINCQTTGLRAFVTRESCEREITDKDHETAYECRHCHFYHPGPKRLCPASGKRCYRSQRSCEQDIEKAWTDPYWKGKHGRMPKRAYLCPSCGCWHMSTHSRTLAELEGHVDPALNSPSTYATIVV